MEAQTIEEDWGLISSRSRAVLCVGDGDDNIVGVLGLVSRLMLGCEDWNLFCHGAPLLDQMVWENPGLKEGRCILGLPSYRRYKKRLSSRSLS